MPTNGARSSQREVLPVPDLPASGLVTYDAKDPDTSFAPIEELRPPEDGSRDQDTYNMSRRKNFPGVPDVSFQALGQRIDLLFEFGKTKRPTYVAVRNVISAEYDVFFKRPFEQRQL